PSAPAAPRTRTTAEAWRHCGGADTCSVATIVAKHIVRDRPPLRLEPREIHLWSIPIDVGADAVPGLMPLLSSSEQQRARRYIFESVQQRFVAARAALRLLVGRYLDMPAEVVRFAYGPSGKPH